VKARQRCYGSLLHFEVFRGLKKCLNQIAISGILCPLNSCNQKRLLVFHLAERNPLMRLTKATMLIFATSLLLLAAANSRAQSMVPNPVLYMTASEPYTANGKNWIRYSFDVLNKDSYPSAMFAAAPTLPPCGANTKASRSWVDFFDQRGKRLYGFCALGKPADLNGIWFAVEEGVVPPSYVYIEINDRQTNTKYKSNLADTTL
jgi:hypothetical protein